MAHDDTATVHGVDGCRGGWICARLHPEAGGSPPQLDFRLYETFADCLAASAGGVLVVDIPIGLLDTAAAGGRPCDRLARRALGWPRRNSVFSPPARPALHAMTYGEATRLNGAGITQQAFRIAPKIREVDEAVGPDDQRRVLEGHPEMAFLRLAGHAIAEPKREAAGMRRRRALIESALGVRIDPAAERDRHGARHLGHDDILDAAALALTARHAAAGTARRVGAGERDARGLEMAIWY